MEGTTCHTACAAALTLSACAGSDAERISRDDLAAQAALDLTAETGDVTQVRCPEDVTLDAEHTARLVCESRYDDYDWSEILVIVQEYASETGTFKTVFANPPD